MARGNEAMSYRDVLAARGLAPLRIERTMKRGQDLVLVSSCMPARTVDGRKGAFAGVKPEFI